MKKIENQKKLNALLYLAIFAVGFMVGKNLLFDDGFTIVQSYEKIGVLETLSDATRVVLSCKGLVLQFAMIFLAAFSPFEKIFGAFVFGARGIVSGLAAGYILPSGLSDAVAAGFIISYFIATMILVIFSCHLKDVTLCFHPSDSLGSRIKCAVSSVVLFMMTCGAGLLVRLLPIVTVNLTL